MKLRIGAIALALATIAGLGLWAGVTPGTEREIACYATGLRGRTPSQIHNLTLAARRINGRIVQPGQLFSFVKAVGPWTADMGYVKAPVSYDGELIRDWGGGVCQTSTTLYNAALLAGLEIVERHRHHWPARYAPLGRDAAVAYFDIDMRFRNTLPAPVRIVGEVRGDTLVCKLLSTYQPKYRVEIESQTRSITRPGRIIIPSTGQRPGLWKLVNKGHPGFCVVIYRRFVYPDHTRRQIVSQDTYPVMNGVVMVAPD